jgi:hypothetical protein
MASWSPVLDRGDGVWLGIIDGDGLGVGSRESASRRITAGNYLPLWPLLEGGLDETWALVTANWGDLCSSGLESPESLLQLVVSSAIDGDRPYWIELALHWLSRMATIEAFDRSFVEDSLQRVTESSQASQSIRHEARRVLRSMGS